ncbi:MAG: ATP-binding cassette domain-containing protein [Sphaerochaetaceae bacterium]|jgi:molybdate transport system ATP-binding protein
MSLSVRLRKSLSSFTLDVSFSVQNGEILGLVGPSGSGKSMSMKCIAGIEKPDEGRIVLNDRVLFSKEEHISLPTRVRGCGYLFQSYALFPRMRVRDNILLGIPKGPNRMDELDRYLGLLHIQEIANGYPSQISGGQQQRVALARILASNPSLIMLDEPFSALDQELKDAIDEDFLSILRSFGGPVIFVSHNKEEITRYCTRQIHIHDGRIIP